MKKEKIIQFKRHDRHKLSLSKGFTLFNEGKCLYDCNKDDLALEKFVESEKCGYESDEMFSFMAWIYGKETANYDLVMQYTSKAIELNEENSYVYYLKGYIQEEAGNYKDALDNFLKAEEYGYSIAHLYTKISYCYEQIGETMKAIAYASKAIKKFPNEVDCYRRKAWAYFYIENYSQALKYFLKAEKMGDNLNYFRISYCYSEAENHKAALAYANKAIISERNNYYGYYRKGFVYYMEGEYEKALKAFKETEKYIKDESKDVFDMYPRMSWIYQIVKNDLKKAEEYAQIGITLNPEYPFAQYRMGCVYSYGYKNYKEAMKYFKQAYKLDKDFPELYYDIAQTCLSMKKLKQGLEYADEGLESFPDNFDIQAVKISLLYLKSRYSESREMIENALEKYPENIWLRQAYGLVLLMFKEYEKSLEYFEPIRNELANCNPFALFGLCMAYEKLKRYDESLDVFLDYTRIENIEYIEKKDVKVIKRVLKSLEKYFQSDHRIIEIKTNFAEIF